MAGMAGIEMIGIGEESLRWFGAERVEAAEPDLTALVRAYSGLLYRVALSVVRNAAEAEDVVQDTFMRVLQQRRLSEVREWRPWLVKIAWNLAIDRKRRVSVEQMDEVFAAAMVSREVAADDALAEAGRMKAVMDAIDRLPKKEREVLLLSAMEELSTEEIGKVLGRSESSVRSLMFRARGHLRERLKD
jgi:RNA polymerase sigma-70 factor (ECF subfamily)